MNPYKYTNRCPKEPYFGFDDIQKGDKIQTTKTHTDGTVVVVTGTADHSGRSGTTLGYWKDKAGNTLASTVVLASWTYEYKLLERPEPKDHIVVRFTDGEVRSAQTNPCPKKEAFETKARWDKDGLLSPQDRGYEYRVMKLVEADA